MARQGHRVLALDSDLMPGLALSLGVEQPAVPPLIDAAERGEDGRWRLKPGIGPVRAVQRYAIEAPDGIRLLQCGKLGTEGLPAIQPAVQAYYRVIHRIARARPFDACSLVGDLPAGPRQVAYDWAPFARTFIVVVEPTSQSMLTARRVARIAGARGAAPTLLVASKVRAPRDVARIEGFFGRPVAAAVPLDPQVRAAERSGIAPLDHAPGSDAVSAIERLLERLAADARVAA